MDDNEWLIYLSERCRTLFFETEFEALSTPEKVFVAIWLLEADVNNGGFDQYYLNSSGDHAQYAPEALRTIRARATAEIVEKANAAFGASGPPAHRHAQQVLMGTLPEGVADVWEKCDQEFYAYPCDLTGLLAAYARDHISEIRRGQKLPTRRERAWWKLK